MTETLGYLVRYGYILLPLWVFAEQMGTPLPSAPILLAAGALVASGRMNMTFTILLAAGAALTADLFWFHAGRARGQHVIGRLCHFSMEPDSCVRRAKNLLDRHGLRLLLVAKFVPGLNTIAAPIVGSIGTPYWMFVLVDLFGILVWIATFELLGFVFSAQLEKIAAYAFRASTLLLASLATGVLVAHIVRKYVRRRSFLQALRMARITASELKQKLDKNEPVTIIDLRHSLDFLPDPYTIPGAIRIPLEELEKRQGEIPRDREVVLYCTCPNEASSAITAVKLRQVGISPVRPFQGGFHSWRQLGFPVESAFDPTVQQIAAPQFEPAEVNPNTLDKQSLSYSVTPPT